MVTCVLVSHLCSSDKLALHLTDQRNRAAETEKPEAQEVPHQFANPTAWKCCRRRHVLSFTKMLQNCSQRSRSVAISWCLENTFNAQTQPGRLHLIRFPESDTS